MDAIEAEIKVVKAQRDLVDALATSEDAQVAMTAAQELKGLEARLKKLTPAEADSK